MNAPISIYLHDHLSGAQMAIELLQSMHKHQKDESLQELVNWLLDQLIEDRKTLSDYADQTNSGTSSVKEFTAWLSEKATRLKVGGGGPGEFETFEALEFLALGVLGKRGLWRALKVATAAGPQRPGLNFDRLIERAEAQYAKVESRRLGAAASALR